MLPIFQLLAGLFNKSLETEVPKAISGALAVASGDPKAMAKGAGTLYDTLAPLPLQALTYSPEAEAAFIGPEGIKRLLKAGEKLDIKKSRFSGRDVAEVNPPQHSNVWWEMGSIEQKLLQAIKNNKDKAGSGIYRTTLGELIAPEEFPLLYKAYPGLAKTQVRIDPSQYQKSVAASYDPRGGNYPSRLNAFNLRAHRSAFKEADELVGKGIADSKDFPDVYNQLSDSKNTAYYNAIMDRFNSGGDRKRGVPGRITLNVPAQSSASIPGRDFAESLLHEVQHAIQNIEGTKTSMEGFKRDYTNAGRDLEGHILNALYDKGKPVHASDKVTTKMIRNFETSELRSAIDQMTWKEKQLWNEVAPDFWPPDPRELLNVISSLPGTPEGVEVSKLLSGVLKYSPQFEVSSAYTYKMNPFEREAFEASKRDTNLAYRKAFAPKGILGALKKD